MDEPTLLILDQREYKAYLQGNYPKETVWYWHTFGDVAMPRGFLSRNGRFIVVLRGQEHNMKLLIHEYAHHLGQHHPLKPWDCIKHAVKVGFDARAAYGVLRWREGKYAAQTREYLARQMQG